MHANTTSIGAVGTKASPKSQDNSTRAAKNAKIKGSNRGWWHSASREDCLIAETKMITAFVDLKRIDYEARDVAINFDARPVRVINKKSMFESWFGSDDSGNDSGSSNNTNNDTNNNANKSLSWFSSSGDNSSGLGWFGSSSANKENENKGNSNDTDKTSKNDNNGGSGNSGNSSNSGKKTCKTRKKKDKKTEEKIEFVHTVTFKLTEKEVANVIAKYANNKHNNINTDEIEEKKQQTSENAESGVSSNDDLIDIVIAHGYASALCIFVPSMNHIFDDLISQFARLDKLELLGKIRIHCIDWLGCGLSSHPKFLCETTEECETFFVESLEAWRVSMKISCMILAGHSIGGYCSACYSLRYPSNVKHLLLLSPAGVNQKPEDIDDLRSKYPWRFRFLFGIVESGLTPFDVVRMAGPKAKSMVYNIVEKRYQRAPNIRNTDYAKKLTPLLAEYMYQVTHGSGSGEYCLNKILTVGAYGQNPLYDRLPQLQKFNNKIKIDFMYGELDWMDITAALDLKKAGLVSCNVYEVKNSGHQVAVENKEHFAKLMAKCIAERLS